MSYLYFKYPASQRASARMSFDLAYRRSDVRRIFEPGFIYGLDQPCSRRPGGVSCGAWEDDHTYAPDADDESAWVDHYAGVALQEAVHEALEWCQVDGTPWLDPHGPALQEIHEAVGALHARLIELRTREK